MPKSIRQITHKPTRALKTTSRSTSRPKPAKPVVLPGGAKASAVARNGNAAHGAPTVTRLASDVELVAPRGCSASVLLKLVDRDDGQRTYSFWAVVGRHDMDTFSVRYKYTGEDVIRFDLPDGMPLSAESLQPYLTRYLADLGEEPGDPPIIRR